MRLGARWLLGVRSLAGLPLGKINPVPRDTSRVAVRQQKRQQREAMVDRTLRGVRDSSYLLVGIVGCGVVIVVGFTLARMALAADSEFVVYARASDVVLQSSEVQRALGSPLRCYAQRSSTSVGRHAGVQHSAGVDAGSGRKYCAVTFYVRGNDRRMATVRARMEESGDLLWSDWFFTQLDVELPHGRVVDLVPDTLVFGQGADDLM